MIAKLIAWSLAHRLGVVLAGLLLLVWGGFEATRTPLDVFPDLTAPAVTLVAEAPGMAPAEVETRITQPIEVAMNGAPDVRRVRSTTKVGLAIVTVEFAWGTDPARARQAVAERLAQARAALPAGLPAPAMMPAASIMGEILFVALSSDRHDGMVLAETAEQSVRRRLIATPGVAEVVAIGGEVRQFRLDLDAARLAAYRLTVRDVAEALREASENAAAGYVVAGGQETLVQGLGRIETLDGLARTALTVRNGVPVRVEDVGAVKVGPAFPRGTGAHNGRPAVILGIQKQPGANTLELTQRLDATLGTIAADLPEGMTLDRNVFRQADFIQVSIDNLERVLIEGLVLVVVIVFVFLYSLRATLVSLVAIPLSLVTAVLVLKAMGATLNTMTLGGMTIALGALVDDAIIVVENIVRRLRENRLRPSERRADVLSVVGAATREIQSSIVFATLIIMLVFVPLFFLPGVEGRLMAPLGVAYIVALAASLAVALTVTPVLASLWLPRARVVKLGHEPAWVGALKSTYRRLLDAMLPRWRALLVASAVTIVLALGALGFAGRAFLPEFNEGTLTVSVTAPPGTALEVSDALGRQVESILLGHPEVVATGRRTGRASGDPHALDVFASEIEVTLRPGARSRDDFLAALRADLATVPGVQFVLGQPISHRIDHMLSGSRANIAVKIFGSDLDTLRGLSREVKSVMASVPGTADVSEEETGDAPLLSVRFDREALGQHGLSPRAASEALQAVFAGLAVNQVQQGARTFDIVLRLDPQAQTHPDAVGAVLIPTPMGTLVPLAALAEIRADRAPNAIQRENTQRRRVVMANVAGRDLAAVVADIRSAVGERVRLPAGYHIEYGGQFESAEAAAQRLLLLGAAVVVGVFVLLVLAFGNARDAALVMANLPLALIGGVAGVFATGGVLTVASMIGFIALFGIATRNGVMMVAHISHLMRFEGVTDPAEAVRRGAEERLVPILMTALATGIALVPLALSMGDPGSEIQAPMAVVMLFGLVSATVLNMLVVPALALRFGSISRHEAAHSPGQADDIDALIPPERRLT